jgi:hypothetical protein
MRSAHWPKSRAYLGEAPLKQSPLGIGRDQREGAAVGLTSFLGARKAAQQLGARGM